MPFNIKMKGNNNNNDNNNNNNNNKNYITWNSQEAKKNLKGEEVSRNPMKAYRWDLITLSTNQQKKGTNWLG